MSIPAGGARRQLPPPALRLYSGGKGYNMPMVAVRWGLLIVAVSLGLTAISSTVGILHLLALGHEVPPTVAALGGSAVTALALFGGELLRRLDANGQRGTAAHHHGGPQHKP